MHRRCLLGRLLSHLCSRPDHAHEVFAKFRERLLIEALNRNVCLALASTSNSGWSMAESHRAATSFTLPMEAFQVFVRYTRN